MAARVLRTGWHDQGFRHGLNLSGSSAEVAVITPRAAFPGAEVWVEVPPDAGRILPLNATA